MRIVTIIPAYNEEKTIKEVVEVALKYSDVLVVDDGSTDNTFSIANKSGSLVIKHDKNLGKGAAIKTGFKNALDNEYEIFVVMDGDGQHDPEFISALVSKMDDADIVIGSRFKGSDPDSMPVQRRFSNKLTTEIIKFVTGYHITDSQSGFRSFSISAARVFSDIIYDDYRYESEMFFQALKYKMVIKEQQIFCKYQDEKSHITWIHVLNYIIFVFKLLLRKYQNKGYFSFKSSTKKNSKEN